MQPARFSNQVDRVDQLALQQLASDLLDDSPDLPMPATFAAAAVTSHHQPGFAELILSLEDIVSDGNGDVVLLDDAGLTRLAIATDAPVVTEGISLSHTVATGEDVSGFAYVTFATGLTLYYPEGLELAVLPHG
jgi:hypothetical protein